MSAVTAGMLRRNNGCQGDACVALLRSDKHARDEREHGAQIVTRSETNRASRRPVDCSEAVLAVEA